MEMVLIPAYDRDYKTKRALLTDFDANKDFIATMLGTKLTWCYINKEQIEKGTSITFLYNKRGRVFYHQV